MSAHFCTLHAYTPPANSGFAVCPFCETPEAFSKSVLVLREVLAERERQEDLRAAGKFSFTCASAAICAERKLPILAEEFGEVAREICELGQQCFDAAKTKGHRINLRAELIQLAAVAAAWVESLPMEDQR